MYINDEGSVEGKSYQCTAAVYPEQEIEWSVKYYMHGTKGAARITPEGLLFPELPGSSVVVTAQSKSNPALVATAQYKIKSYEVGDDTGIELLDKVDVVPYGENTRVRFKVSPYGSTKYLEKMDYIFASPAGYSDLGQLDGDLELVDYGPMDATDADSYGFWADIKGTLSGSVKYGVNDGSSIDISQDAYVPFKKDPDYVYTYSDYQGVSALGPTKIACITGEYDTYLHLYYHGLEKYEGDDRQIGGSFQIVSGNDVAEVNTDELSLEEQSKNGVLRLKVLKPGTIRVDVKTSIQVYGGGRYFYSTDKMELKIGNTDAQIECDTTLGSKEVFAGINKDQLKYKYVYGSVTNPTWNNPPGTFYQLMYSNYDYQMQTDGVNATIETSTIEGDYDCATLDVSVGSGGQSGGATGSAAVHSIGMPKLSYEELSDRVTVTPDASGNLNISVDWTDQFWLTNMDAKIEVHLNGYSIRDAEFNTSKVGELIADDCAKFSSLDILVYVNYKGKDNLLCNKKYLNKYSECVYVQGKNNVYTLDRSQQKITVKADFTGCPELAGEEMTLNVTIGPPSYSYSMYTQFTYNKVAEINPEYGGIDMSDFIGSPSEVMYVEVTAHTDASESSRVLFYGEYK